MDVERGDTVVLVIDEHAAMRYAIARTLKAAGFGVLEAECSADALVLAERAHAVVLHLDVGDIDGVSVTAALRGRPLTAAIPIVLLSSARPTCEQMAAAQRWGVSAILVTPVEPGALVDHIDGLASAASAKRDAPASRDCTMLHAHLSGRERMLVVRGERQRRSDEPAEQTHTAAEGPRVRADAAQDFTSSVDLRP